MSSFFIPKNPIEIAQELQWGIQLEDPEEAPLVAIQAKSLLEKCDRFNDETLTIHTLAAFTLNTAGLLDNDIVDDTFDETTLEGRFVGIEYVQSDGEPNLQTFVLYMHRVRILQPWMRDNPEGIIHKPMIIPVLDVQSAELAA